jgi:hypothetical protein
MATFDINPLFTVLNPGYVASKLAQAQFEDWATTFKPIELEALQQVSYNNPQVLTQAVQEAGQTATETFSQVPGMAERQNRALGVAPTEQQSKTSKRLMDLNQALAVAGAENTARANIRTQDEQLLLGIGKNLNVGTVV